RPAPARPWRGRLESSGAWSLLGFLLERAVGDDADVDAGDLADHAREERAAEDLAAARFVGRADEDVGGSAFAGDAANGFDEVVAAFLEEVHAEQAGDAAQRGQLCLFVGRWFAAVRVHPEGVDVGAEPLRGAPGAAEDPLRFRLWLDEGEHAFVDRLLAE